LILNNQAITHGKMQLSLVMNDLNVIGVIFFKLYPVFANIYFKSEKVIVDEVFSI